ncbi:N-acetyl-gamma-glutamyl-phosphate reductase [Fulvimarina sp. 2208YS6-2-32]|uniref:N-acetyl-gamma-glutamyl-phosphate reductase n=1 Tax=Fulvimarina uroteuthidis TaxID=3098149 RepID=A0ABU5HYD7_9HYPH|nr:N-acetyl-gamma-glutamyl-phosphate reductase [Fulvimarina sp. 2208YS6-2-32]MDY8107815.1 N-acetyl-gamma-glutamyl-phosphate reductase [Fulvimarina sp. 2208YS6-2-32]
MEKIKVGVLGASGYTGADLMRLALRHPAIELTVLTANSHAGKPVKDVFKHFSHVTLPDLIAIDEADWKNVDAVFCGLPHGTTQAITKQIFQTHPNVKIIDMSADFRLRDPVAYKEWYGLDHVATEIQPEAVYGLTELYRDEIVNARLIACPGCYPTAVLLSLVPLAREGLVDATDLVIDAKSGVSGAGRGLKENTLFCEAGEGLAPYAVGKHRHMAEIEQEIGRAAGLDGLRVNFTPHLIPMSRGELTTSYVRMKNGASAADLKEVLASTYAEDPFVTLLEGEALPQTQMVRGSNYVAMNVIPDRIAGRAIVISTLDNLVKGSAGQALQNFNLAYGLDETLGLEQLPLFP